MRAPVLILLLALAPAAGAAPLTVDDAHWRAGVALKWGADGRAQLGLGLGVAATAIDRNGVPQSIELPGIIEYRFGPYHNGMRLLGLPARGSNDAPDSDRAGWIVGGTVAAGALLYGAGRAWGKAMERFAEGFAEEVATGWHGGGGGNDDDDDDDSPPGCGLPLCLP